MKPTRAALTATIPLYERGQKIGERQVATFAGLLARAFDEGLREITTELQWFGFSTLGAVLASGHLAVIFAVIAFWSGAGSWIVVMYGALATIHSYRYQD